MVWIDHHGRFPHTPRLMRCLFWFIDRHAYQGHGTKPMQCAKVEVCTLPGNTALCSCWRRCERKSVLHIACSRGRGIQPCLHDIHPWETGLRGRCLSANERCTQHTRTEHDPPAKQRGGLSRQAMTCVRRQLTQRMPQPDCDIHSAATDGQLHLPTCRSTASYSSAEHCVRSQLAGQPADPNTFDKPSTADSALSALQTTPWCSSLRYCQDTAGTTSETMPALRPPNDSNARYTPCQQNPHSPGTHAACKQLLQTAHYLHAAWVMLCVAVAHAPDAQPQSDDLMQTNSNTAAPFETVYCCYRYTCC